LGFNYCARDVADSVWCWGQFVDRGRGRIDYFGSAVSLGGSCGIRTDGVAVCYDTGAEVEVPGSLRPDLIGKWSYSTRGCAVVSGEAWCWATGAASLIPRPPRAGTDPVVDVDARGCAATTGYAWCWDLADPSMMTDYYSGATTWVHRGGPTGSGVCVETPSSGVFCNGRNQDCAFRVGGERGSWDTGFTLASIDTDVAYTIGAGRCDVSSENIWCEGPGASFGGATPCDPRGVYPMRLTEVTQLVPGCALLRVIPGPRTIECWDAGPPAPIAW
jgi:hypothetical protein